MAYIPDTEGDYLPVDAQGWDDDEANERHIESLKKCGWRNGIYVHGDDCTCGDDYESELAGWWEIDE